MYRVYALYHLSATQKITIMLYRRKWFKQGDVPLQALKLLRIGVHDEVTFVNYDNVRHAIMTHNHDVQNSPLLQTHDTYKIHFHTPGHYDFYSSLYPNMDHFRIIAS